MLTQMCLLRTSGPAPGDRAGLVPDQATQTPLPSSDAPRGGLDPGSPMPLCGRPEGD